MIGNVLYAKRQNNGITKEKYMEITKTYRNINM